MADERRFGGGETAEDHMIHHCRDISQVKARLEEVYETLNKLAVQEQKIQTLYECINSLHKAHATIEDRVNRLQQDHDRCQIGSVSTDLSWIKWFVMGNTIALLGTVMTILAHYIKTP